MSPETPAQEHERKYEFSWDLLGDLTARRPNLGPKLRVEVYRLMQYSLRDVISLRYGDDEADALFREAGRLAGRHFYEHVVGTPESPEDLVARLQAVLRDLGMGILRVERLDMESGELQLTVSEDLDCSGLPELDYQVCVYDEGFIAALLESFTGKRFTVKEVDCWCTGDRTCRFSATEVRTTA